MSVVGLLLLLDQHGWGEDVLWVGGYAGGVLLSTCPEACETHRQYPCPLLCRPSVAVQARSAICTRGSTAARRWLSRS